MHKCTSIMISWREPNTTSMYWIFHKNNYYKKYVFFPWFYIKKGKAYVFVYTKFVQNGSKQVGYLQSVTK